MVQTEDTRMKPSEIDSIHQMERNAIITQKIMESKNQNQAQCSE